ncbi:tail fiber domain-containing protein [bacterium]|nr:tail fiber domain-containing protein [bacterium]
MDHIKSKSRGFKRHLKTLTLMLGILCILPTSLQATVPMLSTLDITLSHTDSGLLEGGKVVVVKLYPEGSSIPFWSKNYANQVFVKGSSSIELGPFTSTELNQTNPAIGITIDGEELLIPVTSAMYAIQSHLSEKTLQMNNTSALFVADDTNRVGIGTLTPAYKLDVNGNIRIQNATHGIIFSDGTKITSRNDVGSGGGSGGSSKWTFGPSDSIYYASGNVGILTETPQRPLHVDGIVRFENSVANNTEETILVIEPDGDIKTRELPSNNWTTYTGSSGVILDGSTFKLDPQAATNGQVLKYNGSQWIPGTDEGLSITTAPGSGLDITESTIKLINGTVSGNSLVWSNDKWIEGALYSASNGISLTNNQIKFDSGLTYSSGRLGINASDPQQQLDVDGYIRTRANSTPTLTSNDAGSMAFDGSVFKGWTGTEWLTLSGGTITLDNSAIWQYSGDHIIVDPTGNMGIGLNSPTAFLHVDGDLRINDVAVNNSLNEVVVIDGSGNFRQRTLGSDIWDGDTDTTYTANKGVTLNGTIFELDDLGASTRQVLKWNGSQWSPSSDIDTLYTANKGVTLNGTTFELDEQGASVGNVLKWDGDFWVPQPDTDTDTDTTYTADKGVTLNGTTFELDDLGAITGNTLKWNGAQWTPSSDANTGTLYTANKGVTLNGTTFEIDAQGATTSQVLKWNGSQWTPSSDAGTQYTADNGVTLNGTILELASQGASVGHVLKWDGGNWTPQTDTDTDTDTTYLANKGVTLNGTTFELGAQGATTSQVLKWNGSQWAPSSDVNTTYTGSNGITLNGTDIQFDPGFTITGGQLGIGTTPTQPLDIDGVMRLRQTTEPTLGTGDKGVIVFNGTTFKGWDGTAWLEMSGNITTDSSELWQTNGNHAVIQPTENIGIGLVNPQAKLDVSGNVRIRDLSIDGNLYSVVMTDTDGDLFKRNLPENVWDGDDNTTYTADKGVTLNGSIFELDKQTATNGQVLKWNDSSNKWIPANDIDTDTDTNTTYTGSNGISLSGSDFQLESGLAFTGSKFGIATSNPSAKLTVVNTDTTGDIVRFVGKDNLNGMSISTSGNVAIGFESVSSYQLGVKGFTYTDALVADQVASVGTDLLGNADNGPTLTVKSVTSNATSPVVKLFDKSDNVIFWVQNDGKTGIGTDAPGVYQLRVTGGSAAVDAGQSWTTASDARFKTNITPITKVLDKLKAIQGVYYDVIKTPKAGRQIGFIAQNLQKEFPEVVKTDDNGYLGVDYGRVTAILLQAVKEQQVQIDELKKEIELLKK